MTDLSRLVQALRHYALQIERHHKEVTGCRQQLEGSLARLSLAYEGTGASHFKLEWAATTRALASYQDGIHRIGVVLDERLRTLEAADRPGHR